MSNVDDVQESFEQHCIAYYADIGEIKAKRARGETLTTTEEILLARAEVRNI